MLELDYGMSILFIGDVIANAKSKQLTVGASKGFLFVHGLSEPSGPTIEYFGEEMTFDATG